MRVTVNSQRCNGHGVCNATSPEVFDIGDDDKAFVLVDEVPAELEDSVRVCVFNCPEQAIEVVDELSSSTDR